MKKLFLILVFTMTVLLFSSCTEDDNFFFCTLDSDCPIGFECVNSYCVEKSSGTPDSVTKQDETPLPQNDNTTVQDEDTTQKDEEQVPDESVDIPATIDEDNPVVTPDETQDEDIVIPPECGNSIVDNGETCEPTDTKECTTFVDAGFLSGSATCETDCTAWIKSSCECPENMAIDGDGKCVDNDECTLETDNCDDNATCTDIPNSFTCACNDYYDGDGVSCTFCNQTASCGTDCSTCGGSTTHCKDYGDNTSACVECLETAHCTGDDICNGDNQCGPACTVESWNFSNTSTGRSGTIQSWTVPSTATYKITAYGAQGGGDDGGLGAKMSGDVSLTKDTVIKILVGQRGTYYENSSNNNWYAGGGGGTFVVKDGATDESGIYVIAGGGGGSHYADNSRRDGSTATSGNKGDGSDEGSGGINGNGGGGDTRGPGGGGFYTNGSDAGDSEGGDAYLNGGVGGNGESDCEGGFGGGGGPDGYGNYDYGGGGGGYSGGGGGGGAGRYCGGGGGSYNSGANPSNAAGNRSGQGYVEIVRVCN